MNALDLAKVGEFIHANIGPQFHEKKLVKIRELTLNTIIKRKNPYLFRAKGSNSASDYIKSVLDASLSSGEESNFGDFIENVAIFVVWAGLRRPKVWHSWDRPRNRGRPPASTW